MRCHISLHEYLENISFSDYDGDHCLTCLLMTFDFSVCENIYSYLLGSRALYGLLSWLSCKLNSHYQSPLIGEG